MEDPSHSNDASTATRSPILRAASPASDSTTPTEYTIDLSAFSKPPPKQRSGSQHSNKIQLRRNRRPSRPRSDVTSALPLSPPHERLDSDELDGPEDFTINMEYWMRCQLTEANKEHDGNAPVVDATMDKSMDSWISRGSDKLVAMQRQRGVDGGKPHGRSVSEVAPAEDDLDAESEIELATARLEEEVATVGDGKGESEPVQLLLAAVDSPNEVRSITLGSDAAESTPLHVGPMASSGKDGQDETFFRDAERIAALEAQVWSLKDELRQSRSMESRPVPDHFTKDDQLAEPTDAPEDLYNDQYIRKKLAQVLGITELPPITRLDRLIQTRENYIKDIETRLQATTREPRDEHLALREEKTRLVGEAAQLREELSMHKADSEARIKYLRSEVQQHVNETRDLKLQHVNAKRDADTLREQLQTRGAQDTAQIENLKKALAESEARYKDLEGELDADDAEWRSQLKDTKARCEKLERDLLEFKETSEGLLETARTKAEKAVTKMSKTVEKERAIKTQLESENRELEEEVALLHERLRVAGLNGANDRRDSGIDTSDANDQSTMSMKGELQNLREELNVQIRAADAARAEARAARDEAEMARADSQRVNESVDARIAETLRRREKEWAARMAALKDEKRDLGRALMRSWGGVECGDGVPQKYRYQYVQKT